MARLLADRFAPVPLKELVSLLDGVGLNNEIDFKVCVALCYNIDKERLVYLNGAEFYSGWTLPIGLDTIADMYGLARETVSRHVAVLIKNGVMQRDRVGRCYCYRLALWSQLESQIELQVDDETVTELDHSSSENTSGTVTEPSHGSHVKESHVTELDHISGSHIESHVTEKPEPVTQNTQRVTELGHTYRGCLLYTSPSPRDS